MGRAVYCQLVATSTLRLGMLERCCASMLMATWNSWSQRFLAIGSIRQTVSQGATAAFTSRRLMPETCYASMQQTRLNYLSQRFPVGTNTLLAVFPHTMAASILL